MARVIRASPGPPLGSEVARRRPVGRVGGVLGRGTAALAVGSAADVVADWDACRLDGAPVEDLGRWRALLAAGRLPDVDGAFAVAWRTADGAWHLARDPIGERTLYYAPLSDGLAFASTVPALLATGLVPRTLDLAAVAAYLTYAYVPGDATLVAGIRELLPGEVLHVTDGTVARERFWTLPAEPAWESPPDAEILRQDLRRHLEEAVRRRLPTGEAVGAFLSGGIDSSLVVALARRLSDKPVLTWSVSFGPGYANELPWSSLVAGHCGTDHRIVELSPAVVLHHLDDAVAALGKPIGDPLTVPNALLFREAAADVGVVLNGRAGTRASAGRRTCPCCSRSGWATAATRRPMTRGRASGATCGPTRSAMTTCRRC